MGETAFDHARMDLVVQALHEDLYRLQKACDFTLSTLRRFVVENDAPLEFKNVDEELVAWVLVRFDLDEGRLMAFLHSLLDQRTGDEEDLFGWAPPNRIDPDPEAEKLLDRIDISLNYLRTALGIDLPAELKGAVRTGYSIRNGQLDMKRSIQRAMTFATAAREILVSGDPAKP